MTATMLVHIVAGSLAIVSGYVAVVVRKGGRAHLQSGRVFLYSMLVMSAFGFVLTLGRGAAPRLNVPAALLTFYLVITGVTTVRPPGPRWRWLERVGTVVAALIGSYMLFYAAQRIMAGKIGPFAYASTTFGIVLLLCVAGDVRVMRKGMPTGTPRLVRHLWRMCFAFFIATGSFFMGQADVFPERYRIYPLLAIPAFAPLVIMFYWLWRMRAKRRRAPKLVLREPATA